VPNVSRNTITAPTTSVLGDDPNVVAALEFHKSPMGGVGHSLTDGPTWLAAPRRVKDPTWVRRALKSLACYTPFFFGLISLMTLSAFFMAVAGQSLVRSSQSNVGVSSPVSQYSVMMKSTSSSDGTLVTVAGSGHCRCGCSPSVHFSTGVHIPVKISPAEGPRRRPRRSRRRPGRCPRIPLD